MSPARGSPWQVLGIAGDASVAEVRRCYAALVKQYRPDSHPEDFARVREAYEIVLPAARRREALLAERADAEARAAQAAADRTPADASRAGLRDDAPPAAPPGFRIDATTPAWPGPPPPRVEAAPPPLAWPPAPPPFRVELPPARTDPAPPPAPLRIEPPAPSADGPSRQPPPVRIEPAPPAAARPPATPRVDAAPPRTAGPPRRLGLPRPDLASADSRDPAMTAAVARLRALDARDGEHAALPALRSLLDESRRATIDARLGLELALLDWFMAADDPPLLLMFDAGRAFDWHGREARLSASLPDADWRRLALLLTLARDFVFARHYAGDGWLRRAFTPGSWRWPVGWTLGLAGTRAWAERWQLNARSAGSPAVAARLDPRVLGRLDGALLLSTDLLVGLWVALLLRSPLADLSPSGMPAVAQLLAGLLAVIVLGLLVMILRRVGRRVRALWRTAPRLERARRLAAWATRRASPGVYVVTVPLVLGILAAAAIDSAEARDLAFWILGVAGGGGIGGFALWMGWAFTTVGERAALGLVSWREAVDRLEFRRMLASPAESPAPGVPPFGRRLRWWERLRVIGEALRQEPAELARRERPPRVVPLLNLPGLPSFRSSAGSPIRRSGISPWWLVWVALMVIRLVAGSH